MLSRGNTSVEKNSMSDRYFLDTNIFVYSFDKSNPEKQNKSLQLIERALQTSKGIISYQVVQEFLNVSMKKFTPPLSFEDSTRYFEEVLAPLLEISSSIEVSRKALKIAERWQFSFYDSLIISGALAGDCSILYTEDMQHLQQIESLRIVDPFKE